MILHCATPVTVNGTPCAVSTFSHIGFSVITSRDKRWTSVTSHHAQAHPPTIVLFLVDPQQPPEINEQETRRQHYALSLWWRDYLTDGNVIQFDKHLMVSSFDFDITKVGTSKPRMVVITYARRDFFTLTLLEFLFFYVLDGWIAGKFNAWYTKA